jgi:tRNA (mo5U34)-methyltransferase
LTSVPPDSPSSTLSQRVAEVEEWYHTIELAPGVVTPGWFDLRSALDRIPFPSSLAGRRCLDVGTFDGFWAFEMERRGAEEVVAVDVLDPYQWDWPVRSSEDVIAEVGRRKAGGRGFEIAHEALGSKVRRHALSVYDLDPAELGVFDFVYVGSLLLHLRDPVRALERVRSVCTGELLAVDAIDLGLTAAFPRRPAAGLDGVGRPWWWKPNVAGLVRMVEVAGFDVTAKRRLYLEPGAGQPLPRPSARMLMSRAGRETLVTIRRGDPHAAVFGRPR